MSRLAARRRIVYLTPLALHAAVRDPGSVILRPCRDSSGVVALTPLMLPGGSRWAVVRAANHWTLRRTAARLLRAEGIRRFVSWTYFPAWTALIGGLRDLGEAGAVYDIQDNYAAFPWAPAGCEEAERELLAKVDLVFTGTRALWEKRRGQHTNAHFLPGGVEFNHFARRPVRPRPFPANRPILGYYGYIDCRRIDADLLDLLGERHPEWVIWMIGPVHRQNYRAPRAANVIYAGPIPYADLPEALGWFDVALMPFALNDLTRDINPNKTPEYLAAEKPVVATAIPDIERIYGDVVAIARTPIEFLAHCERAVRDPQSFPLAQGVEKARGQSWEAVVSEVEERLAAIGK